MVSRLRFATLILAILGVYGYLIFNIYNLQIVKGDYYATRSESQYRLAGFLEPHRGLIYFTDKDGSLIPAALNKSYPVIFAVPKEIDDATEAAAIISSILNTDKTELEQALANKNALYKLLVKKATMEQVSAIKEVDLKGVYVDEQEFRFYPFGDLAAHLLGFIGLTKDSDALSGRYGLERQFEEMLRGVPGNIKGDQTTQPVQGEDLALTIDRNIQGRAEEILRNLVSQYQAEAGSVIVADPQTGNLLAWGSYPNFDPNDYSQYEIKSFLDPISQAVYEPGSVFKPLTMSMGLDSKKITPETTYYDSGHLELNGRTIQNWDLKSHGTITMTNVIERSINTGSAFAARQIGKTLFDQYLAKYGFDQPTGVQLANEVAGDITKLKNSTKEINLATASFGQGISVTPIALLSAFNAIANGGTLIKPNLLKGDDVQKVRRVVSVEAAQQATAMMVSAVDKARIARIANYKVAGKTGTAQVPDFQRGGYTDEVINTYIGFAPATNPRFVILIKIDKPAGAPLAGLTVVPAFRELAEFVLNYYNVSPDNLEKQN